MQKLQLNLKQIYSALPATNENSLDSSIIFGIFFLSIFKGTGSCNRPV